MSDNKNDLGAMSTRRLLARRRALAERLGSVEEVLAGSLAEQTRRCGKAGCRCAAANRTARMPTSPRARRAAAGPGTVPAGVVEVVRRYLQRGEQVETALAEISAINAELLARRVLE